MSTIDIETIAAALSHGTRVALLRRLVERPGEPETTGDLATWMGKPPSTVSRHLAELEDARLVEGVRHGQRVPYGATQLGIDVLTSLDVAIASA